MTFIYHGHICGHYYETIVFLQYFLEFNIKSGHDHFSVILKRSLYTQKRLFEIYCLLDFDST